MKADSTLVSVSRMHDLRSGRIPLSAYLEELEVNFNDREPQVRAFLPEPHRFDRLRREAQALEARFPEPAQRPPLYGMPVGVKDIFHVDGFPTQAGSKLPLETLGGQQAQVVSRLLEAGCLVLGKTVTTEFAYFAPGPTRNPHNLSHTPGGSSSGSAAAVAALLCPLTLGTQTIGSIIRPASFCGVVGLKPTYDRISREGVIPLAPSVDHVGLFAPSVDLLHVVLPVVYQAWQPGRGDRRPVLGIPSGPYLDRTEAAGRAHFEATWERLTGLGYEVKSVPALLDFDAVETRHNQVVAAEAARVHHRWVEEFGDRYHQKTMALIDRGREVTPEDLEAALASRQALRSDLEDRMAAHGLDAWLAPSALGPAPEGLDSTGDPVMNLPWTHAGLPTINLPSGSTPEGLPIGVQVVARWGADEPLLVWAREVESALGSGP